MTTIQTMLYKTLHKNIKIEEHESDEITGWSPEVKINCRYVVPVTVQTISFYQRKGFEAEDSIYDRKQFLIKMLSQNVMQSRLRHSCLNYTRQIAWIEQEMLIFCLRTVVSNTYCVMFLFTYSGIQHILCYVFVYV